ncbi:MalY/PatB family protein [Bombilactobacillus thymidiniphilus]|uniref:cysteine-S-conjugate beta-lyase n=1 Tax=Bombilactobacillus thymidiniphilus TaxID=2923363 RepID=A0ABY4PBI0_9LACO|nr:PatB family C-S lyase [Bombilactobacillus thymidiniphilus]UQS83128.1 PatB family C-S lyase [Bombilactobacillus thymidiniphilus]
MEFDQVQPRKNTYSIKWDGAAAVYHHKEVLPMWIADMDFQSPPAVVKAICEQAQRGIYGYVTEPQTTRVPQVIADWLQKQNDWQINRHFLGYSAGVVNGLSLAIRALTQEGDAIITQTPLYGHFQSAVESSKRRLVTNPLHQHNGRYEFDWQLFEQQIQTKQVKMAILCNPHNPTGRVWTIAELKQFAQICERHQVIILSDDIHSDLILPGYHYQPLAKVYPEYQDQIITFKSPSKTFNLAGLQFAYYYTTNKQYRQQMTQQAAYACDPDLPTAFALPAVIAAYEQSDEWLLDLLCYLKDNLQWMTAQIETTTAAKVTRSEATYLSWIDVSYLRVSEKALQTALADHGVGLQTNEDFGLSAKDGLFIRLNFATARKTLEEGVNRLIEALQSLEHK